MKQVTKKVCYITSPVLQYFLVNVVQFPLQGQPFNFHYYVVITRSHMVSITKPGAGKKRKKEGKKDEATAANDGLKYEEPPTFDHFENEILQKVGITSEVALYPVHVGGGKVFLLLCGLGTRLNLRALFVCLCALTTSML